jgi:hypothetical protein
MCAPSFSSVLLDGAEKTMLRIVVWTDDDPPR